jgi:hypothetical protein
MQPRWVRLSSLTILSSLDFPSGGCWEVTGAYTDTRVTLVVWVTGRAQ